jgi:hypothetical protein
MTPKHLVHERDQTLTAIDELQRRYRPFYDSVRQCWFLSVPTKPSLHEPRIAGFWRLTDAGMLTVIQQQILAPYFIDEYESYASELLQALKEATV